MNLVELARKTIESSFKKEAFEPDQETKRKYKAVQSSFVTLTINNELRGCIGSLLPRQELYKDVQENAINASFHDSRFPKLKESELKSIKIEVSILSEPKRLYYKNEQDLLNRLFKDMGIILRKGHSSATFLPQVWEQLKDPKEFLEHLSQKAGLDKDAWKTADIYYYMVNVEEE